MKPSRRAYVRAAAVLFPTLAIAGIHSPVSGAVDSAVWIQGQSAHDSFVRASVTVYPGCRALRRDFPRGVARGQAARDNAQARGYGPATVHRDIFKANSTLDRNDNKVVCEVRAAKARRQFRADLLQQSLPVEAAGNLIDEAGYEWRVGVIDGEGLAVTLDYNENRLTLEVSDGIVVGASWG
jgi:hypothetical protein